ncbi:MAG: carboxymuconolactone decarboxylase family protein [Gemmatimonadaceae bacterium]
MQAHAEFLRRVTLDESLIAQLRDDYRAAAITPAERAMLDFAVQLSVDATRLSRDDIEGLKSHGFDDRAILQITLIASWFNYINRVADALGVGRDDPAGAELPVPEPASWVKP